MEAIETYDALVVGSGAAGSFAAKELTERGLRVLLLEAGRDITGADFENIPTGPKDKGVQLWARASAMLSGQHVQARVAFYGRQFKHLFVNDREHPYTAPKGTPYLWIRGRQLGGRLHTFGRVLMRWSDYDFKAASRDGHGEDWPISYSDLESYYNRVEEFLGLCGQRDQVPNVPDGQYIKEAMLTPQEKQLKAVVETSWPGRRAISWRYIPPNRARVPAAILAAKRTGRLTIRTNAVVTRIETDPETGRATGVHIIDRKTHKTALASARVVVLCASTIESIRLLLNSASPNHPRGLANSSGTVGHYFMDQVPSLVFGSSPTDKGFTLDTTAPPDPFYAPIGGLYVPRFANLDANADQRFVRGFSYQGTIGRAYAPDDMPAKLAFMGFGEMLPYPDNRVTLNESQRDQWGMPIPHIACAMHDNERQMLPVQTLAIVEMLNKAGFRTEFWGSALGFEESGRGAFPEANAFSRMLFRRNFTKSMSMGAAIHESGGVRMGSDPRRSVLNARNQAWDVPNLFVTDGSSFVSGGSMGTTLTIMALTVRACEYIAQELKSGTL